MIPGLTQLMRKLLTQDGHRGADALEHRRCKRRTNGQPVDEVVQAITQCDHPGQCANVRVGCSLQPIAAATRVSSPRSTVRPL